MKGKKKLISSILMLLLSATMLGTSTYAWFTMNKEVSVVGMEVTAHAEEGLLINEVATADSTTWDEEATANTTPTVFALRPASTADLTHWWHASSKLSSDEAGVDNLSGTVDVDEGKKYTDLSAATDEAVVSAAQAVGNTKAETHVYYKDTNHGTSGSYDEGEGYYVMYKYYLKSSSTEDLVITENHLGVTVTATKINDEDAQDLDKALRVGVKIGDDILIFAPVAGADASYGVTNNEAGSSTTTVTPKTSKTAINPNDIIIPKVTDDGLAVEVYVWFEGEDTNCMSYNLTAVLNSYEINIKFTDDDLT
jgi:hypothetical protein